MARAIGNEPHDTENRFVPRGKGPERQPPASAEARGRPVGGTAGSTGKEEPENPLEQGGEQIHEAVESMREEVAEERQPRWRALRRGRVWLAVYSVVVLIVLALALAAHTVSVLPGDLPFTRELQETTLPGVAGFLYGLSVIGNPSWATIIVVAVVALLLVLRMPLEAVFTALTALADAVGGLLKLLVGRSRPAPSLVHVVQVIKTPSFPSGHTLHFTVFFGFLFFIVATNFKSSWQRNTLLALLAIPIAFIGLSRVYLGEHWLSDVVGGYLVGALCLAPLIAGYLWAKERYVVNGHTPFFHRRVASGE